MSALRGTTTSDFGVSGRENHNSDSFYSSKVYRENKSTINKKNKNVVTENNIPCKSLNKVFCQSSENMKQLPDNSVHLMVTSPPYNVGKEYDNDLSIDEYRAMLINVWRETHRVLVDGGRACINIANIGRKPYIALNTLIGADMNDLGFLMRGEIIWNKAASAGGSCAWGSWKSPSNPVLRDTHEYIMIFCKNEFGRNKVDKSKKEATITRDEFLEYTKSIWTFNTESAKRVKHAAPFPLELPRRLIQLYTYKNDIVLDPFMGSGTTAIAAAKSERNYIGYELSKKYIDICESRIKKETC